MDRQFDPSQQQRAITLLESFPWGDMDAYIPALEDALRRAMEGTRQEFQDWEDTVAPQLGIDEFGLSADDIKALPCRAKLAWVARMLRTLAMAYGVSTDFLCPDGIVVGEAESDTPAALLRGLNDIVGTPRQN